MKCREYLCVHDLVVAGRDAVRAFPPDILIVSIASVLALGRVDGEPGR